MNGNGNPQVCDQLDMFVELDVRRPLTCPACGYSTVATMWSVRMYHGWAEAGEVCSSMDLLRNHVLYALATGRAVIDERFRKKTTPESFEGTMRRAVEAWGDRAHDFIPDEHWPVDTPTDLLGQLEEMTR